MSDNNIRYSLSDANETPAEHEKGNFYGKDIGLEKPKETSSVQGQFYTIDKQNSSPGTEKNDMLQKEREEYSKHHQSHKNEVDQIIEGTPFNTYDDLFYAVFNSKAKIHLSNGACRQIAQIEKPIFANLGMYLGLLPSIFLTVFCSAHLENYYLLLLLLLELVFPISIYALNGFKIKTWPITLILVLIDFFVVKMPAFIWIIVLSWMFCSTAISIWQRKIYTTSVKILRYNKDAFKWAYNSYNLLIEDHYGNTYSKSYKQNK